MHSCFWSVLLDVPAFAFSLFTLYHRSRSTDGTRGLKFLTVREVPSNCHRFVRIRTKDLSQRKVGVNVKKKKELSLEKKTFVVLFLKFTAMRRADMTNLPL